MTKASSLWPGDEARVERTLQQQLRQQRLGVDIGALAEQNEAGGRRERMGARARRVVGVVIIAPSSLAMTVL